MPVDFTLKESGSLHSFYTNKDYSLFGVIGNPISHSKSPELHNHWLKLSGLSSKAQYIKINITKSHDLKEIILTMPKMGFVGCNITVPFKEDVFNIISELEEQGLAEFATNESNFPNARTIGAVNCLFFNPQTNKIEAYNTDVTGFIKGLILTSPKNKQNDDVDIYIKSNLRKKLSLGLNFNDFQIYKQKLDESCLISKEEFKMFIKENSRMHLENLLATHSINALLIGAGGSARAVLCASSLFNSVTIANRSMQNALNLCAEFAFLESVTLKSVKVKVIELSAVNPQDYNLIINATPLGLKAGEYPDIKYEMIDPSTFCYDLIYPKESPQSLTPFLLKCKEAGAHESRLINGYGMLIGQAAESYKIWTGHEVIF